MKIVDQYLLKKYKIPLDKRYSNMKVTIETISKATHRLVMVS
jgi:hypothetical protein